MAAAKFTYERRVVPDGVGDPRVEHWVSQTLSDPWIAEYRFEWSVAGEPLLAEVRVALRPDYPGLKVSRVGQPALQVVPPGGLTTEVFREARLGEARAEISRSFDDEIANLENAEEVQRILAVARLAREHGHREGGWDDLRYVRLASAYVQKCRDGSRKPVKELAEEAILSPARIRQALTHARKRGWLTETTRRRPGGTLTDEAWRIRNQAKEES